MKRLNARRAVRLAGLLLGLAGCGDQEGKSDESKRMALDPTLMKASPLVAQIEAEIKSSQMTNCLVDNALRKKTQSGTAADKRQGTGDISVNAHGGFARECKLYTAIADHTSTMFSEIKRTGRLPDQMYVFSILQLDEDEGTYTTETVGLFGSVKSCEQFEALARDAELATKRCRRWVGGLLGFR